jgi:hypothetical protein
MQEFPICGKKAAQSINFLEVSFGCAQKDKRDALHLCGTAGTVSSQVQALQGKTQTIANWMQLRWLCGRSCQNPNSTLCSSNQWLFHVLQHGNPSISKGLVLVGKCKDATTC